MCGIFGIIVSDRSTFPSKKIRSFSDTLFKLSESRGSEASGIAISTARQTKILKFPMKGTRLIRTSQYQSMMEDLSKNEALTYPVALLGHARLATNGVETDNRNNQPVTGENSVVVHNILT